MSSQHSAASPIHPGWTSDDPAERRAAYAACAVELDALLAGEDDPIARMATTAALLFQRVPRVSFVGFYRVVSPELLVVGPYQGPPACLRIPFARGVCGAAARERRSQLVPDVHAFPGHIACDAASRSELVVPVFAPDGALLAVLDLDSHAPSAFDQLDQEQIERLMGEAFGQGPA